MPGKKIKIAETTDLPEDGSRIITEVEGREIAVFRIDGSYHALLNYCVHEAGPLCEGPVEGKTSVDDETDWLWAYDETPQIISCPWHSWKFDLETGKNIQNEEYQVPTYPVEIENGEIYIEL